MRLQRMVRLFLLFLAGLIVSLSLYWTRQLDLLKEQARLDCEKLLHDKTQEYAEKQRQLQRQQDNTGNNTASSLTPEGVDLHAGAEWWSGLNLTEWDRRTIDQFGGRGFIGPAGRRLGKVVDRASVSQVEGPSEGDGPLVYVHIPKTGGTTVSRYLESNWIDIAGCTLVEREAAFRRAVELHKERKSLAKCIAAVSWKKFVPPDVLVSGIIDSGLQIRYEHGHHPVGLCDFLRKGCAYTTVLREPIHRSMSHYDYLKTLPESTGPFVAKLLREYDTVDKLLDAVENGRFNHYGLFNMHTLLLSGDGFMEYIHGYRLCPRRRHGCDVRPGELSWAHVQLAKRILLRDFPVIGFTSHLREYAALMLLRYGYGSVRPLCQRLNQNPDANPDHTRIRVRGLTMTQRMRIMALNKYDLALYNFARGLIRKQILAAGPAFPLALDYVDFICKATEQEYRNMTSPAKA